MTDKPIYPALEERIAANGIRKRDIAEMLRMNYKTFCNKLKGVTPFTWEEVRVICEEFFGGCDPRELFTRDISGNVFDAAKYISARPVLGHCYSKLTVKDLETGESIAVVTNDMITTARESTVVVLTPNYA